MLLHERSAADRAAPPGLRAQAAGLGCCLPPQEVSTAEVARRAGVEESWILKRTGIRSRRHAPPGLGVRELAAGSARRALQDAGVQAGEIELLVLATVSQERRMPNLAPAVAADIGADAAGAFDLGGACSGFVTGLAVAAAFIESGRLSRVLVVGADTLSRFTDQSDPRTAPIFGDGAGAIVMAPGIGGGVSAIEMGADGSAAELIRTDADGLIRMDGPETFRLAVATMARSARSLCKREGVDLERDVDLIVFHQANGRITRALTERLGVDPDRIVDAIAEVGNTSAASVPLALEHARAAGRLRDGDLVLLAAVGAGFTSSAALMRWGVAE
jgi:3-oxoacyl-[acyl-carrier-protein] synthase-3